MNTNNLSGDIEGLLASSDPALEVTELELMRSRKRSLSVTVTDSPLVSVANTVAHFRPRRGKRLWLGAGALAGAGLLASTMVLVTASAPTPPDRFLDATRIIPSLSEPQKDTDKVPATVNPDIFGHMMVDPVTRADIDPTKTRRVGQTTAKTYYAAPAGNDYICMTGVDKKTGTSDGAGCVWLKNFESYGMKSVTADGKESVWLMVPAAMEKNLESVENEPGWTQQAPNFLVRDNNQQ